MNEQYTIAMEIKSESYFGKGIFLFDLFFMVGYWFVMSNFESLVYPSLRIFFTIFNVTVAFLLTRKSAANPGKRLYQSMAIYFLSFKNNKFYAQEAEHEKIELIESE